MRLMAICAAFIAFISCANAQERLNRASLWEHNGSIMAAHRDGNFFVIWYENPSDEMRAAGVEQFTNLFEGFIQNRSPTLFFLGGRAYVFSSLCGAAAYEVAGQIAMEDGRETITLNGLVPLLNENCEVVATTTENQSAQLKFYFIRLVE